MSVSAAALLIYAVVMCRQRKNARRAKLDRLRESIDQGSSPESERLGRLFSAAVKDTATVSDKHSAMKTVLMSLGEQRQRLEQKVMGAEEEFTRKSRSFGDAALQLREAKETSQLSMEDARSLHWELELEESAVAAAENRLRQVGQQLQLETLQLDTLTSEYQVKLAAYEDLSKVRDNFRAMAKEAQDQLQIEKVEATRNWRSTVGMMERHGPTCAKDNEVREIQVQLLAQLENLTQSVSATKSARRELVFQIKQEKEMLSLTKSSVKAKRDQMEWLKRQRAFLESEYRSLIESRSTSEQAYHESVKMHKDALAKLDDEKAAAKSTLNQIEGEIVSSEANAKALSTQISDERKRLNQQLRKRRTKEKKQKSSSVNLDAMQAEIDSARQILAKTQSAQHKQQELLDKMTAENEELQHTLTNLQKQTQDDERALQELSDAGAKPAEDIAAAKKELRSILQDPNFSDWENIIEWVNQKIAEERSDAHAQLRHDRVVSAKSLRERFEAKFKALDEKCGKMLGEKRSIYDGMVKKKQSSRHATTSTREGTLETLSRSSTNKHQTRGEHPDPKSSGKLSAEDLHKSKAKPDGNPVQEKSTTHKTAHPSDTIQPVPRLDADSRSNTATPSPIMSPTPSLSSNVSSHQLTTPPERVSVPRQHGSSTRKKLNPRAKPQAPAGNLVTTPTTAARPRAQRSLSPSGECVSSGERMSQSATEHSSTADSRFLHDDKENMPPPRSSSINQAKSSTQLKQPQPQPKRRSALSQAAIATRGKLKVTKAKVGASQIAIKRGTKKLPLSGRKIKSSGSGIIGSTTMTPSTASSSSATRRFASDWLAGDGFSFD